MRKLCNKHGKILSLKKELIANPAAAIEKTVYINIPAKAEVDTELNEEQLESVVWYYMFL
ncbi:hypothetical protein [Flavobacterium sp. FPG59]|uniref:hypothetical protein n=1 Tax=Flavobacterium sp. FPG59 TaxID=1929267 RepID=UPI000A3A7634|nr:hypothetical protein [Flavobacterium sp. FPG59]OUD32286.1 hypothetical protein FPG59_14525 [Flavobacterium sp. FPG59]